MQRATDIRSQLDHPIIDGDGHTIEVTHVLLDYVEQIGGPAMVDRYRAAPQKRQYRLTDDEAVWTKDSGSWVWPTRNTLDRATATLPRLYAERLDEFGIDYALIYPSEGLSVAGFADDELRVAASRAYNTYIADSYGPYADRMTPAAVIPMHTPQEAVAELHHAVEVLGLKVAVLRGHVRRPATATVPAHLDFLGLGSDYDYDPVWAACAELGVAPTFHTSAIYGGRVDIPNYVYNHIGVLAAGGEATCKALFMGGVTGRFPNVNFGFLEGGVGWAVSLYADILSHWERRNGERIGDFDPANLDLERFLELVQSYGDDKVHAHLDDLSDLLGRPQAAVDAPDNFAAVPMEEARDAVDLFAARFWFGCEADDPVTAHAFNRKVNPFGVSLQAIFGSDNAHWDVPDMAAVVGEAWELVEHGLITEDDFKAFVCTNAVQLHGGMNPSFFHGTRVETATEGMLQTSV